MNFADPDSIEILSTICQFHLDEFVKNTPGIVAVMIASVDGFEVASTLAESMSASKLAALTGTMYALSETLVAEAGTRDCQNVIVETPTHKIIMLALPHIPTELILTVIADNKSQFGMLLFACHTCRNDISEDLQANTSPPMLYRE